MDQKLCVHFQNIHNCSAQKLLEANDKNIDEYPVYETCTIATPTLSTPETSALECFAASPNRYGKGY